MDWKLWPCIPLRQREQLPQQAGIYVIVDTEEQVWYVGKSVDLNARWKGRGHHRYQQLNRTNNRRSYKIYWNTFSSEQLDEKEQLYIDLLKPHLNNTAVRTYARKSIQPNEELSRLFKALNRKTNLFPEVRSIVLGYYTDLDEDEEGNLQSYTCIVTVVHVNDHDNLIVNSVNKSLSRKGRNLKGCWCMYESRCGHDDPDLRATPIYVFLLGNTAYEFVFYPHLIDKLEKTTSNLCLVNVSGQPSVGLRNPEILGNPDIMLPLDLTNRRFSITSEDYIRYRAKDLMSITRIFPETLTA